jgi:hypothetical protein
LLNELSWVRSPYGDGSSPERLDFHALRWAVDLFDAFDATTNRNYLSAGLSLVQQWIRECLDCEDGENVWSDHATALRAIVLCQAWIRGHLSGLLDTADSRFLFEAAARHAKKLKLDSFYRPDHDHGVTQAYAQFALGSCFRRAANASAWTAQGLARLERQMLDNVSTDGILKEHSPYYQLYVLQQFYAAHELAPHTGRSFSSAFRDRLARMAAAGAVMTKPDGTLPALGDTSKHSPIVIDPARVLKTVRAADSSASTNGRLWTVGGCAVFRSGHAVGEPAADERFLMLRLANFEMPHHHHDLLSFEFYAHGDDLIVDSGGPFQYAHPTRTRYFTAPAAHNVILIEGLEQKPVERARIVRAESTAEHDILVAEHTVSTGAAHTRMLCFVRSGYIVLLDVVTCASPRIVRSLLHFNPALDATLDDNGVRTSRSGAGPTVSVLPLHGREVSATLMRGQEAPMQGWVCTGPGQMTPGTVLEYRTSGDLVVLACVIVAQSHRGSSAAKATVTGSLADSQAGIVIDFGDREDEIVLSPPWSVRIARSVTPRSAG